MPKYVEPPEVRYYPDISYGVLTDTTISSLNLGNSRIIRIYTPPNYLSSSDSFPLVLFHDGPEYISSGQANNALNYLIARNRIRPLVAVFVPPVNRTDEYAGSLTSQFTSFIVYELIPVIERRYRIYRNPAWRAVLGASFGGNISLLLAHTYPNVFGNVAAQSPYVFPSLVNDFQTFPRLSLKVYVDVGTYDFANILLSVNSILPVLRSAGYNYRYLEVHEGHNYGNWRAHIDDALEFFFGIPTRVHQQAVRSESYRLDQNFPNPFNPSTTIRYALPARSRVRIDIYNTLGQKIQMPVDQEQEAGEHELLWNANVPTGVYFYRIVGTFVNEPTRRFTEVRRMLLLR